MGSPIEERLGEIAVREGIISPRQLDECCHKKQEGDPRSLEEILLDGNLISPTQLDHIRELLQFETAGPPGHSTEISEPLPVFSASTRSAADIFGRVAVDLGYAAPEAVRECLEEQKRLARGGDAVRLGDLLVRRGILTADQHREVLRTQQESVVPCASCFATVWKGDLGPDSRCPSCGTQIGSESPSNGRGSGGTRTPVWGNPSDVQTIKYAAPTPTAPHTSGERFGKYRVLGEVGRGSIGIVYRAHDEPLDRVVALKALRESEAGDPGTVQRFLREGKAAARLSHESIVTIHEIGAAGATHYFTMDFVEGDTLEDLLSEGRIRRDDALRLLERVARALDYAHGEGVFHRGLAPSNILVDVHGRPHLTDFGLGAGAGLAEGVDPVTIPAALLQHFSPEQVRGDGAELDARSDVYSLGVILYRVLTGMLPHSGGGAEEIRRKILETEPRKPRQVDPGIDAEPETICRRAMEKDRALRYASAREFSEDISRYLAGRPIEAKPVSVVRRLHRRLRRSRSVVAGFVLLLAGLGVGGVLLKQKLDQWGLERERREAKERRERAEPHQKKAEEGYKALTDGTVKSSEEAARRHDEAVREAGEAALLDAAWAEPPSLRAKLRELKGELDEALADWDGAVERDSDRRIDRARCRLLRVALLGGGMLRVAGSRGQSQCLSVPDPPWTKEEMDAVRSDAAALLAQPELSPPVRAVADAMQALAEGRFEDANQHARKVESLEVVYPAALQVRALAVFRRRNERDSTEAVRLALECERNRPRLPGQSPAADFGLFQRSELEWALRKARSWTEASVLRGLLCEALGDSVGAEREYASAAGETEALAKLAHVRLEANRLSEARRSAEDACNGSPVLPEALLARAACAAAEKKWADAIQDLDHILAGRPNDLGASYLRGVCRSSLEQLPGATEDAKRVADLAANFYPAWVLLAEVQLKNGKTLEAETEAKRALKIRTNYVPAIKVLARVHRRKDNRTMAIQEYSKAILLSPGDPDLYFERGQVKMALNDWTGAREDFEQLLKRDPRHRLGRACHAMSLYNTREQERALREIDAVLQEDPELAYGYCLRGMMRSDRKEWDLAVEDFDKALELKIQDAAAVRRAREAAIRQKRGLSWRDHFAAAMRHISQVTNNTDLKQRQGPYAQARESYLKGVEELKKLKEMPSEPPLRSEISVGLYNLACTYSVDGALTEDAAKRRAAIDQALEWLEESFRYGFDASRCPCHRDGREHTQQDADLEVLRTEARFKQLFQE